MSSLTQPGTKVRAAHRERTLAHIRRVMLPASAKPRARTRIIRTTRVRW